MTLKLLLNFEIESDFVDSRSGTTVKNGKEREWEVHTQKAWVYLGSKFPKEMQIVLESAKDAVRPGLYQADLLPALDVGDFGKLVVDVRKLRLHPVAEKVKAA